MTAGFPYLVGEEGRGNSWCRTRAGTIVPNDKLGGLGGGTVNNYNTFIVQVERRQHRSRSSQIQAAAQIARLTSTGQRNSVMAGPTLIIDLAPTFPRVPGLPDSPSSLCYMVKAVEREGGFEPR